MRAKVILRNKGLMFTLGQMEKKKKIILRMVEGHICPGDRKEVPGSEDKNFEMKTNKKVKGVSSEFK